MKKLLLFTVLFAFVAGAFAQSYKGTPWTGTPWTFGTDNNANFNVGNAYTHKKGIYNGVPHFLYDIGEVDTSRRAGDDLVGDLVAGAGIEFSSTQTHTFRLDQATTDGKTLTPSDIAAIQSPNYSGLFTSHENRAVTNRSGGWYRYTVNITEAGNYNLVIRCWGNDQTDQAFWFRLYEKATMNPLIPWTRYHPGSGNGDPTLQEGLAYEDMTVAPYDGYTITTLPSKTNWMKLFDQFTMDAGEIVLEYCDPGPIPEYGESAAAGGSFGEFVFEYAGPAEDKFAPVAEVWGDTYDEADSLKLTLSEPGTLYLVPDGTAEGDLETANIDKMEMTTETYIKATREFLDSTLQIVTKDAAGNTRFSAPITVMNMIIPDTTSGTQGDTIGLSLTRSGIVALLPIDVPLDLPSILAAYATGNADTANVTTGSDNIIITNLSGNKDCNLFLFDIFSDPIVVSNPVPFTVVEDTSSVGIRQHPAEVNLYVTGNHIILNHSGDFKDMYIFDMLGKLHMQGIVTSNRLELDASGLTNGIYIMKLRGSGDGIVNRKFLISR